MQPCTFILMIEGLNRRRKYERDRDIEHLHLLRTLTTKVTNLIRGLSGEKGIVPQDLHRIPELDTEIEKLKEKREQEFENRAEQVLDKYRKYSK